MIRSIGFASRTLGNLETQGPNRGPQVDLFRNAVSPYIAQQPIPWCAAFVFWALRAAHGLTRAQLSKLLGFEEPWYPESCDSWLQQARANSNVDGSRELTRACVVATPLPGDLFLWMRRQNLSGGRAAYSPTDAIHIGFVQTPPAAEGERFDTLEGNTCPESAGDGKASREGNGVYQRTRPWVRGGIVWIGLPPELRMED